MTPKDAKLERTEVEWLCLELGVEGFGEVWELQKRLVHARKWGRLDRNTVLILEHEPVFTLGRRGGKEFLTVSETFLEKKKIPIFHIERGGYITYHGPGQLVVYLIFDLAGSPLGVADYVARLEDVMIRLASDWGVGAQRNQKNPGVWVGNKKMGSLGIAIRRGICFHGFALNVNVSMEPFAWVHPCGLDDIEITSMARERNGAIPMRQVRQNVRSHLQTVFHAHLTDVDPHHMEAWTDPVKRSPEWKAVS